jgi:hypothetical protein
MRIKIDGEIYEVDAIHDNGYLPMIVTVGKRGVEWYLAKNDKSAGEKAREYWLDMAENDPAEFRCIVGDEALISWALGQNYAPGAIGVDSLKEWLDLWLDIPEEQWASYDGEECTVDVCGRILSDELGFIPTVAYRHN